MSALTEKLLEKSKEAFVLAIEIYNKPIKCVIIIYK